MATEKLLVKTKDDHIRVLDITYSNDVERARLKNQCETLFAGLNLQDSTRLPAGVRSDNVNTDFLNQEISDYSYRKNRANFTNKMHNDPPVQPNTLYVSHRISDDEFPEVIKNLGFKISPSDKRYRVHYNSAANKFEITPKFVETVMSVDAHNRSIVIVRNHFQLDSQDYQLLETLKQQFARAKQTRPDLSEDKFAASLSAPKARQLFYFYAAEIDRNSDRETSINHELKHILNAVFMSGLSLKKDSKRMQVEDCYRIQAEDERSAYLGELVNNINAYLQKGDFDDFSMFNSNNSECVDDLKRLHTPEERLAYVQNWPHLVAQKLHYFEREKRDFYDSSQLPRNFQICINNVPLAAPEDVDRSEFKKLRSLFYNFQIYNPTTHRMEQVNLAHYITPDLEVSISADKQQRIIEPMKAVLNARLQEFEDKLQKGEIDVNLINTAKKLIRSNVYSSQYVTEIDSFRIAELFDDNTNSPTPTPPSAPTPSDRAEWSDGLKRYWQRVDGYRELAKNNNEYMFKIHDATVRYTGKKKVELSCNADYALYDKMLKEPSNRAAPIEFLDTLTEKQKLLLYIACVNNGRRMIGHVPTDLSGISHLRGIPEAEMNRFIHRQQSMPSAPKPTPQRQVQPPQRKMLPSVRQEALKRRMQVH